MFLDKFKEPIEVADKPLDGGHKAYRMDGGQNNTHDMRKHAGLGTCDCCDYLLLSQNGTIVLIEDKQIMKKDGDITDIVQKCRLKVYGAMLVLCRLAAKCSEMQITLAEKKYEFWLVASGMDSGDSLLFAENLQSRLLKDLRGVLSRQLITRRVKVIPSSALESSIRSLSAL